MCGINGIVRFDAGATPVSREELLLTRESMALRGPDGSGLWLDENGHVGLGHRRLAIIDLSDAGAQPMKSADGRYTLVFNGEIYNYRRLREALIRDGANFRSHCDTEVLLELYARHGAAMLPRLRGMFTIAIWDRRERSLFLARDPLGIKPLYIADDGRHLRFASQVKALLAGGAVDATVDPTSVAGFLMWGSVPEPRTLYRSVRAVPAGHYLLATDGRVGDPVPYYDLTRPPRPDDSTLEATLEECVGDHLESDVPVAVFLSSGLDSSLLAALARRKAPEGLTTFTLQFDEFADTERDEAPLARQIAESLGTKHIERRVGKQDFLALYSDARRAMDQPTIDGFNTYMVSHAVREAGFKVVLSGLGGDELMGSYDSFSDVPRWQRRSQRLASVPGLSSIWPRLASLSGGRPKLRGLLRYGPTLPGAYFLRRGLFLPEELPRLLGTSAAADALANYSPLQDAGKFLDDDVVAQEGVWRAVHVMETTQYMRNQLLRDSDWASMAHSLELRVPLVDAVLRDRFDAAHFEPAQSHGKSAVVRRVAPELPAEIWNRPKSGFGIPVAGWIDETLGHDVPQGEASRALALRVLRDFNVDLDANG
ncbi:MAG: asparagine synthase (glutamine-hydrolyzing) [Acidobacteriota bacterium]|nr:asparagine synthase (glutamine-hydrolyzing) [Acidobacteriota bacterium]MDH3784997.1 asparagine synthase (glutamine-hydrolyzing) [Acidobacteriota bacterium]